MDLKGKTAIVTGSGRGIGRAIAREFARQGARVVCCARHEEQIAETAELIREEGGEAIAVPTDVADRASVMRLVELTLDTFGQIDVLFNNAGRFNALGPLWQVNPDDWWLDVTVNLRGPMVTMHAVLPHMIERDEGIVINMNGGGSIVPLPGGSGYGCSKAALMRLTESTARELERIGSKVLVLAIGPGFVRTEMTELQMNEIGREWIPGSAEALEAGKSRPPEDCAKSSVELLRIASPELNGRMFSTGQDFEEIARTAAEIAKEDRRVMRMV